MFVDEHNRHKRLKGKRPNPVHEEHFSSSFPTSEVIYLCKCTDRRNVVMRACEGCRRRKIKCDAATTNTWPCAACTRLKLHCVPPQISYENDSDDTPGVSSFALESPQPIAGVKPSISPAHEDYRPSYPLRQPSSTDAIPNYTAAPAPAAFGTSHTYNGHSFVSDASDADVLSYDAVNQPLPSHLDHQYQPDLLYPSTDNQHSSPATSNENWQSDGLDESVLAEAMGDLKIEMEAVGMS